MPFHRFENLRVHHLNPHLSTGEGPVIEGEYMYFRIVTKKAGTGSTLHYHPNELMAFPLRGKILNSIATSQAKLQENKELLDLVSALGCGLGKDIRLEPVLIDQKASINELLNYYMGKNTQDRQDFIIENLRVEKDVEKEMAA